MLAIGCVIRETAKQQFPHHAHAVRVDEIRLHLVNRASARCDPQCPSVEGTSGRCSRSHRELGRAVFNHRYSPSKRRTPQLEVEGNLRSYPSLNKFQEYGKVSGCTVSFVPQFLALPAIGQNTRKVGGWRLRVHRSGPRPEPGRLSRQLLNVNFVRFHAASPARRDRRFTSGTSASIATEFSVGVKHWLAADFIINLRSAASCSPVDEIAERLTRPEIDR